MKPTNDHLLAEIIASGRFRVTDTGRIETNRRWNGHRDVDVPWFVCDRDDGKGYRYVSYHMVRLKAHRVAYCLYHPDEDITGWEINHLDGDTLNNTKQNLELCNASRQSKHAFDIGLNKSRGERNNQARLTEPDVRFIRGCAAIGVTYARLARDFGVTPRTIALVCQRKTWAHVT